jgi:hypothetical protein
MTLCDVVVHATPETVDGLGHRASSLRRAQSQQALQALSSQVQRMRHSITMTEGRGLVSYFTRNRATGFLTHVRMTHPRTLRKLFSLDPEPPGRPDAPGLFAFARLDGAAVEPIVTFRVHHQVAFQPARHRGRELTLPER